MHTSIRPVPLLPKPVSHSVHNHADTLTVSFPPPAHRPEVCELIDEQGQRQVITEEMIQQALSSLRCRCHRPAVH